MDASDKHHLRRMVALPALSSHEDTPSTSPQIHVLAVDDSVVDRKVIENLLKTSSYKVTTVDSALGALEILGIDDGEPTKAIQFNMIITDYCMPHMTGYDLLKRVKGTSFLKEIPVVVMSSEKVETRINSCYEEGAEDFIIKPVRPDDLARICAHFRPKTSTVPAAPTTNSKKRKRSSTDATIQGSDAITCN